MAEADCAHVPTSTCGSVGVQERKAEKQSFFEIGSSVECEARPTPGLTYFLLGTFLMGYFQPSLQNSTKTLTDVSSHALVLNDLC